MYGLLGCLLPTALKKRWSGKGRSSHAHTTPKLMESMANCCWCGDCHSFEILDGIYFFIWFHWVSTILLRKVCVLWSFILFPSGQFCLWNSLPHEGSFTQGKKVRRWCFRQLQNCTTKENSDSFSSSFLGSIEFWAITTMTFNPFIFHKRQRKKAHAIIKNWRNFLWRMPKPILLRMWTSLYDVHKVNSWVAENHPQESHLS